MWYPMQEPASTVQRGKDGHLTLNTKGNDFFSSGGASMGSGSSRRMTTDAPSAGPSVAQQKFGGAKAISSKDFEQVCVH